MDDFYVYAWLRPCGTPFYIGKGRGGRDRESKRANPHFRNIVDKIRRSGDEPIVIRILENLDEDEAFELERALIDRYGRSDIGTGILVNLTDGGDGPSGRIHREESIEKMRAAHSNISAHTRAKMSAAQKGKKLSDSHRRKIGEGLKGRIFSEESRRKIGDALRGFVHSDETRANMSDARKGKSLSAEHKAKIGQSSVGRTHGEDARLKVSEAQRKAPAKVGAMKGVYFQKSSQKWHAQIYLDGKNRHVGYFLEQEDAALAYDRAAVKAWGIGNCYLNFPNHTSITEAA